MRIALVTGVLVFALILVANTGCMKCGEKASEKVAEKMVEQTSGGKVKADFGTVDISDLPQNLRYPNAVAKAKWQVNSEDGSGTVWAFETKDARSQVVQFYKRALSGWKSSLTSETQDMTMLMYASQDENEFVIINVSSQDSGTQLQITYTKK